MLADSVGDSGLANRRIYQYVPTPWWGVLTLLSLIVAISVGYGLQLIPAAWVVDFVPALFVAVAASALVAARWRWNSLFNPWSLFLMAAILFNGGQMLLHAVGIYVDNPFAPVFSVERNAEVYLFVSLCVLLFVAGGLCAGSTKGRNLSRESTKLHSGGILLWLMGWGMISISLFPALEAMIDGLRMVMEGGYFSLYSRSVATGVDAVDHKLAALFVPGIMFVLVASHGRREWGRYATLILLCLYSFGLFFQGFRGAAVMPIIAYAWLWHRTVKQLPTSVTVSWGLVLLFVVFPLVKQFRNVHGQERLSFQAVIESYRSLDNPGVVILNEMGGSMNTVAHSMELVPAQHDYDYGMGYVYASLGVIPNFGSDIHFAASRAQYGKWLTEQVNPWLAARGGGVGFSFLAEAYVNFGWPGAPLFVGLLGFWIARLQRWALLTSDPARMAVLAIFTSFALMYTRGEFIYVARPFVWFCMIPYLSVWIAHRSFRRFRS